MHSTVLGAFTITVNCSRAMERVRTIFVAKCNNLEKTLKTIFVNCDSWACIVPGATEDIITVSPNDTCSSPNTPMADELTGMYMHVYGSGAGLYFPRNVLQIIVLSDLPLRKKVLPQLDCGTSRVLSMSSIFPT